MSIPSYAMNHIGISVPDIEAAVVWYRDVLGCFVLVPPGDAAVDGSHFGKVVADIFGEGFAKVRMAHLSSANGVGIELFQFIKPAAEVPDNTFKYWRTGIFHFCLTARDIEAAAAAVEKNGGKILSKVWKLFGNKNYQVVYCQDPWGTVVEFYDASYEQYFTNQDGVKLMEV
jgi:catechol 2,3-dioxygenase-like lactoylglutathione lyase family enzyme